jgi:periplasmic copper chaperone A
MARFAKLAATAALLLAAALPAFSQNAAIQVEKPWARATPAGASTGAVYMTLDNKSNAADRLTGVSTDVAATVQVHEMKVVNDKMQMREVAGGLAIPADGSVVLKPGSYHLMLMGLKKPLKAGDSFPLTLKFEKAGEVAVTVPVEAMGATGAPMPGMGHMGHMK